MKRKSLLTERHDTLLSRLIDLADSARLYAREENEYQRTQRMRTLAERAMRYSAAVQGRSMHVRIEQDEELNVTTKQKAKQAAMDLPAGEVKDAVKGARKKRGAKDASKKAGRVRTAQHDQSAPAN